MTLRNLSVLIVAMATMLFAFGCELDNDNKPNLDATPDSSVAGATMAFTGNNTVSPNGVTIPAGGAVTFTNNDSGSHQIDFDDGTMPDGPEIAPGGEWSYTFSAPGTYTWICLFHDLEFGSITVQ